MHLQVNAKMGNIASPASKKKKEQNNKKEKYFIK
jgi:hypothetical protein